MKKFKKILNLEETIALTSGVLVLSVAIALVVIAWTGPTADPPLNNAPAPINVSNIAQTKAGGLTVGNLSLDGVGFEGTINNADLIIGANDLRLRADATEQTKIDLGVGAQEIKFYTNSQERVRIENDGDLYVENGNLHIKNLSDCFLKVDASGKVICSGSSPPGPEEEFQSTLTVIEHLSITMPLGTGGSLSDEYTYTVMDPEVVIKFYGYAWSSWHNLYAGYSLEYENIAWTPIWAQAEGGWAIGEEETKSETRYYHAKQGDKIKIRVWIDNWGAGAQNRQGKARAYLDVLSHRRKDNTTKITSTGNIYYCEDPDYRGEMGKAFLEYVPAAPSSIAATADGIPITIFTE